MQVESNVTPAEETGDIGKGSQNIEESVEIIVEAQVHREQDSSFQDAEHVVEVDSVGSEEADTEVEPESQEEVLEGDSPTDGKKRKQRIVSYIFTDGQEKELGEWYREQECLYNRRHKLYKDAQHKRRLYEDKAASLTPKCTCE